MMISSTILNKIHNTSNELFILLNKIKAVKTEIKRNIGTLDNNYFVEKTDAFNKFNELILFKKKKCKFLLLITYIIIKIKSLIYFCNSLKIVFLILTRSISVRLDPDGRQSPFSKSV